MYDAQQSIFEALGGVCYCGLECLECLKHLTIKTKTMEKRRYKIVKVYMYANIIIIRYPNIAWS